MNTCTSCEGVLLLYARHFEITLISLINGYIQLEIASPMCSATNHITLACAGALVRAWVESAMVCIWV